MRASRSPNPRAASVAVRTVGFIIINQQPGPLDAAAAEPDHVLCDGRCHGDCEEHRVHRHSGIGPGQGEPDLLVRTTLHVSWGHLGPECRNEALQMADLRRPADGVEHEHHLAGVCGEGRLLCRVRSDHDGGHLGRFAPEGQRRIYSTPTGTRPWTTISPVTAARTRRRRTGASQRARRWRTAGRTRSSLPASRTASSEPPRTGSTGGRRPSTSHRLPRPRPGSSLAVISRRPEPARPW
jgi:hypothetical protein